MPEEETMERIVVGVDGSENARRALEWAIAEANIRQARLTVVSAWQIPNVVLSSPVATAAYDADVWRDAARETVEAALQSVTADDLPADIDRQVIEGPPAKVLVDAAKEGDMIVVGSRGRGGFAGLLLGSVSQQVAHHARCPVVIVPHER
jgi:nucleotide-binding universal stress UspA family protein